MDVIEVLDYLNIGGQVALRSTGGYRWSWEGCYRGTCGWGNNCKIFIIDPQKTDQNSEKVGPGSAAPVV